MVAPPLLEGAVKVSVADVAVADVAVPIVGAVGTVAVVVAGKTAVTVPELALLVTDVAPATVKKLAITPVKV